MKPQMKCHIMWHFIWDTLFANKSGSSEKEIEYYLEIITCNYSICTMDLPKLIVSIQKKESNSTQRVKYAHPSGAAAPQPLSISSPDIRTYTPLPSPPSNCSAETETPPPLGHDTRKPVLGGLRTTKAQTSLCIHTV